MDDDRASRTICIPLVVPDDRVADLHRTRVKTAYCQQRTVDHCWDAPKQPDDLVTSKSAAEDILYGPLREETDELHANLVQKAIKDVTSTTSSAKTTWENGDRVNKPTFPVRGDYGRYAITYDRRAATFSKHTVTLATVGDTVECRYILPDELQGTPYDRYVLNDEWDYGTSKLVFDGERFWLHLVRTKPVPTQPVWNKQSAADHHDRGSDAQASTRVLGVDLNVDGYSVVTSAGGFYGNADSLNHRREQFERVRGGLQQTGTQSAHRTIREMNGREWRFFDAFARDTARGIAADAVRTRCTHAVFEDLTRIRQRISNLPKFQQWLFKRVRSYTEDYLELLGIDVDTVDPDYTSQRCSHSECDSCTQANLSGKEFACVECGLALNRDYNAARNVAFQWFAENDDDQSGRTCSAGRATSQLALKSGTLTPDGEFSPGEWLSTDKPTSSLVGS
jgi:IS605 OrfB family transposase